MEWMSRMLKTNHDMIVIVCIDDILIYIQSEDKHVDHLMIMFQVLTDQNYLQSLVNATFVEIFGLDMSHFFN